MIKNADCKFCFRTCTIKIFLLKLMEYSINFSQLHSYSILHPSYLNPFHPYCIFLEYSANIFWCNLIKLMSIGLMGIAVNNQSELRCSTHQIHHVLLTIIVLFNHMPNYKLIYWLIMKYVQSMELSLRSPYTRTSTSPTTSNWKIN